MSLGATDVESIFPSIVTFIDAESAFSAAGDAEVSHPVPVTAEDIEGVKFTKQGARAYGHEIITKTDPRGGEYFWIGDNDLRYKAEDGTDTAALREGYISITPLITNYTDMNFKKIKI